MQYYFVRKNIANNSMELWYIFTKKQITDGLIKLLYRDLFQAFRKTVGVE
jgi:hypothetical protein